MLSRSSFGYCFFTGSLRGYISEWASRIVAPLLYQLYSLKSVIKYNKFTLVENTDHPQMHKESFIINRNTPTCFDPAGSSSGRTFCYRYTKVVLYSWVRMCCGLSKQPTAHSHSTIKCNLSVTITKSPPWRWPSRVETCRSVLRLMIKLSLCILLVISVFELRSIKIFAYEKR
jgi:hypothetical protein